MIWYIRGYLLLHFAWLSVFVLDIGKIGLRKWWLVVDEDWQTAVGIGKGMYEVVKKWEVRTSSSPPTDLCLYFSSCEPKSFLAA
jgi:hypothetical protein